jgi:hypothetical protein
LAERNDPSRAGQSEGLLPETAGAKTMPESNVEPKITAEINRAAQTAATEVNKQVAQTREEWLKYEYDNPVAPVSPQGVLDHVFLEQIKNLIVWKDRDMLIPDYEKTKELRDMAYEGYERKKTLKPGTLRRPISNGEILAAIQGRIERAKQPPEIVANRFVHKEN